MPAERIKSAWRKLGNFHSHKMDADLKWLKNRGSYSTEEGSCVDQPDAHL